MGRVSTSNGFHPLLKPLLIFIRADLAGSFDKALTLGWLLAMPCRQMFHQCSGWYIPPRMAGTWGGT